MKPSDNRIFNYIYCNGCKRYVARYPYPQTFGWCETWLRQDCTVDIIEIRASAPDPKIEPCICQKQRSLL